MVSSHPVASPAAVDGRNPANQKRSSGYSSALAPGSVVEVRDEEWLVTGVQTVYERSTHQELIPSRPVQRIEVQGLSELVRDTSAVFFDSIDTVTPIDPRLAPLINDESSGYRDAKLWLEATLMKTATAVEDTNLTVRSEEHTSELQSR